MSNVTIECFKEIEGDFGTEIAIGVVQIRTTILTTKVKKKELFHHKGAFTARVRKRSRKLLWEMNDDDFEICWDIVDALPSWMVGREMFGLGGTVEMRLKDLITPLKRKVSDGD